MHPQPRATWLESPNAAIAIEEQLVERCRRITFRRRQPRCSLAAVRGGEARHRRVWILRPQDDRPRAFTASDLGDGRVVRITRCDIELNSPNLRPARRGRTYAMASPHQGWWMSPCQEARDMPQERRFAKDMGRTSRADRTFARVDHQGVVAVPVRVQAWAQAEDFAETPGRPARRPRSGASGTSKDA